MIVPARFRNPETGRWEGVHAMFLGQTGFGKTYLLAHALAERRYVVVHDGKRTFREKSFIDSSWTVCENLGDCRKAKTDKICYSPSRSALRDQEEQENFFEWVLLRGHTTLAIDELTLVAHGQRMPLALGDLYATGREPGCEVWACTQQPVMVPSMCFTQSRAFYIFYSALEAHREKIAGFVPIDPDAIRDLQKRQYYVYEESWREAKGPFVLQESSGR